MKGSVEETAVHLEDEDERESCKEKNRITLI